MNVQCRDLDNQKSYNCNGVMLMWCWCLSYCWIITKYDVILSDEVFLSLNSLMVVVDIFITSRPPLLLITLSLYGRDVCGFLVLAAIIFLHPMSIICTVTSQPRWPLIYTWTPRNNLWRNKATQNSFCPVPICQSCLCKIHFSLENLFDKRCF